MKLDLSGLAVSSEAFSALGGSASSTLTTGLGLDSSAPMRVCCCCSWPPPCCDPE